MTDTPIIDAAEKAFIREHLEREGVIAALRAAFPWDLPAERLEAMARAMFENTVRNETWAGLRTKDPWRSNALAAYRAHPIMRELLPEKFT